MIKQIQISGFRGFGIPQIVPFAIPSAKKIGSGLTIITGANNSGKTTIIESIRAFNGNESPSFSEGRRNANTDSVIELIMESTSGNVSTIKSVPGNGSSTEKIDTINPKTYILQSRRAVPFEFGKTAWDREAYITYSQNLDGQRTASLDHFDARIFQIEKRKSEFDLVLQKVFGEDFRWTVEQRDTGKYYIKYIKGGISHSSEGVGDGIWSIFTICAALFDAPEESMVVIDEPELSIHPAMQKRLMKLLGEYAQTRQIVISTHSPYFVDWNAIINGAMLIRTVKEGVNTKCYHLSNDCRTLFKGILKDLNNPHTLGLVANEVFFLNDKVILVEGQEDVVIFNKIATDLGRSIDGDFFGWGVGGATKMRAFLKLFNDLGYKKVIAILDGDKKDTAEELEKEFSSCGYRFFVLPTDDIRDKEGRELAPKIGIATDKGRFKDEHKAYLTNLFDEISAAFCK